MHPHQGAYAPLRSTVEPLACPSGSPIHLVRLHHENSLMYCSRAILRSTVPQAPRRL